MRPRTSVIDAPSPDVASLVALRVLGGGCVLLFAIALLLRERP
jgi:hypothetical protein